MRSSGSKIPILNARSSSSFNARHVAQRNLSPPRKKAKSKANCSDASTDCDLALLDPQEMQLYKEAFPDKKWEAKCKKCIVSRIPIFKNAYEYRSNSCVSNHVSLKLTQRIVCPVRKHQTGCAEFKKQGVSPTVSENQMVEEYSSDTKPGKKHTESVGFVNETPAPSSPRQSFADLSEATSEEYVVKKPVFSSIGFLVNPTKKCKRPKLSSHEIAKYRKRKRDAATVEGDLTPFFFGGTLDEKLYNVSK